MHRIDKLERLAEKLAADLVEMHNDTAIELEYWETARLLVELFYDVKTKVEIGEKFACRCQACHEKRHFTSSWKQCENEVTQ